MNRYYKTLLLIIAFLLYAFFPLYIYADEYEDNYVKGFNETFPDKVDITKQADETSEEYAMRVALLYNNLYTKLRDYHLLNHNINTMKFNIVLDNNKALTKENTIIKITVPVVGLICLALGEYAAYVGRQ